MSHLNVLVVGENPNVLFYAKQLHESGKFAVHLISKDLNTQQKVRFTGAVTGQFDPEFMLNSLEDVKKVSYDVVVLSAHSLQEISTLSTQLSPLLGKNTIILVESTGFVNLEPFVTNCLPQKLNLSVFSILTSLDIRQTSRNEFSVMGSKTIYIGQSGTINSKYAKAVLTDLKALGNILQVNEVEVILRSTHLEFLAEQWKFAIPRICFDPLLILFEESSPQALTKQILAKPLLSGLVTEMITVAKTMGCKLPQGSDNESQLLKTWSVPHQQGKGDYMDSPSLFYNFFYKNKLNIDMLLLQPILLADDHGIKTPYLEFLYATLCQFEKLNTQSSLFFKRNDSADNSELKREVEKLNVSLASHAEEYKTLVRQNEQLQVDLRDKEQSVLVLDSIRAENQQLQKSYQQKSKQFQLAEQQISQLQHQLDQLEQKLQHEKVQKLQLTQKESSPPVAQVPSVILKHIELPQPSKPAVLSEGGTPDLRDLTDVALYSTQMDSTVVESSSQVPNQLVPQVPTYAVPPVPTNGDELSARELELQKKEQQLISKENALNKKLSQMNLNQMNRMPQQLQPPLIPKNRSQGPPQHQPHQHQQAPFQQGPPVHHQQGQVHQQYPQQPFQQGPPRRTATMTAGTNIYAGIPSELSSQQFKPTSRKNRKSSFPMISTGHMNNDYAIVPRSLSATNGIPTAQSPPFHQQLQQQGQASAPLQSQSAPFVPQPQTNGFTTVRPQPQFAKQRQLTPSSDEGNDTHTSNGSSDAEIGGTTVDNSASTSTNFDEDLVAKPLGGVVTGETKDKPKKKKGFFGRKK
jgi:ketopantoate reductase